MGAKQQVMSRFGGRFLLRWLSILASRYIRGVLGLGGGGWLARWVSLGRGPEGLKRVVSNG